MRTLKLKQDPSHSRLPSRDQRRRAAAAEQMERIVLSERDSQSMVELLNNPPELTKGLCRAIERKYG